MVLAEKTYSTEQIAEREVFRTCRVASAGANPAGRLVRYRRMAAGADRIDHLCPGHARSELTSRFLGCRGYYVQQQVDRRHGEETDEDGAAEVAEPVCHDRDQSHRGDGESAARRSGALTTMCGNRARWSPNVTFSPRNGKRSSCRSHAAPAVGSPAARSPACAVTAIPNCAGRSHRPKSPPRQRYRVLAAVPAGDEGTDLDHQVADGGERSHGGWLGAR